MNTPPSISCPDRAHIRRLLLGQASDSEYSELESHLLLCDRCSQEADSLIPSAEVTAMLTRAETQVFRTRETELVEQLIKKVRSLRTGTAAVVEQTLIGSGDAGKDQGEGFHSDNLPLETNRNAIRTAAIEASAGSNNLRPAEKSDEIGRIGGYRILQVLGSGGMGVVYRAEELSLKRLVALKVMKPVVAANPEAKARFLKEAEATAAIEHDNIVTIYQVGEDNGVPYIAMQFLKGESLQARLDRCERLAEPEVLRLAREIAEGLQAAHARGLIHRDIKPDNIWLQEGNDRVRIVDFGLVRNNAEDAGLTQSGIVLGTPKYMAPEQARGGEVDHRCDLFSLGSVMYRMLTGRSPFEGSNLTATLIAVAHEDPQPVQNLAPNVSPQLADLIARLLSKNPSDRPATASAVALILEQLTIESIQSENPKAAFRDAGKVLSLQQKPHHADGNQKPPLLRLLPLLAGGFVALILLATLVIRLRAKDGTVVIELESAIPVAQVQIDGNEVKFTPNDSGRLLTVSVPEGTHELVLRTADGVSLNTELGTKPVEVTVSKTTKIRAWLDKPSPATSPADGQSKFKSQTAAADSSARQPAESREKQSGQNDTSGNSSQSDHDRESSKFWPAGPFPSWSGEDLTWAMLKEGDVLPGIVERPAELPGIGRWNVDTIQSRGTIHVARYSPDGKWLATGSNDGHVRVYDASTMKLHQLLPGLGGGVGAGDLSWHPDSVRIAVAADNKGSLRIWTVEGQLLAEETVFYTAVSWTFDGSRLICGGDNRLDVRDKNGMLLRSLLDQEASGCDIGNISVSPDSQRFACWHWDKVRIWNAETFDIEHTIDIACQQQSTGGHRIRWSSEDRISLSLFDRLVICSANGRVLKEFPSEQLSAVTWRSDGEHLTVWRWDPFDLNTESGETTPANERISVPPALGPVPTAIDWSPDGKQLVVAAGRLAVCNEHLNELDFDSGVTQMGISGISLNPDGTSIAAVRYLGDQSIHIWSSDGIFRRLIPLNEQAYARTQVAWSPDGSQIAAGSPMASHLRAGAPEGSLRDVVENCLSFAWNPDGTQLAAGLTNGHILITDRDGNTLYDVDTGESEGVVVGWSKQGTLAARVGDRVLRIDPDSTESKVSLLTNVPGSPVANTAVWRPDGVEVCFDDWHVNVANGVTERVRHAAPAAAWSPDGSLYLQLATNFSSLFRPDGTESLIRVETGAHVLAAGAWNPSGDTIFIGYDQSLLISRNAADLHVKWSAVILPNQKSITFDVGGSVRDGEREILEEQLVYYSADATGNVKLLSLSEFELKTGEQILPVPGRYFDAEYRFSISPGADWKPAALEPLSVPGIVRAAYSRPGGVSLNLLIQESGAYVDPSWLVAESAKKQEEKHSATVLEKEVRKIRGRDSMWMLVEGQGTGSAITGTGSVKTTQHWIAIPRESDILVALLTSPSGTFETNQKFFLKAIETLTMNK